MAIGEQTVRIWTIVGSVAAVVALPLAVVVAVMAEGDKPPGAGRGPFATTTTSPNAEPSLSPSPSAVPAASPTPAPTESKPAPGGQPKPPQPRPSTTPPQSVSVSITPTDPQLYANCDSTKYLHSTLKVNISVNYYPVTVTYRTRAEGYGHSGTYTVQMDSNTGTFTAWLQFEPRSETYRMSVEVLTPLNVVSAVKTVRVEFC